MSDAKKLLSKMLIAFQNKTVWQDHGYCSELVEECRRYLREFELEPKPEPLSLADALQMAFNAGFCVDFDQNDVYGWITDDGTNDNEALMKLVKAIEKSHGIFDK